MKYKAVSKSYKILTIIALWLVIGISIMLIEGKLWLSALLLTVAIGVSWHVLSLRTLTPEMLEEKENCSE